MIHLLQKFSRQNRLDFKTNKAVDAFFFYSASWIVFLKNVRKMWNLNWSSPSLWYFSLPIKQSINCPCKEGTGSDVLTGEQREITGIYDEAWIQVQAICGYNIKHSKFYRMYIVTQWTVQDSTKMIPFLQLREFTNMSVNQTFVF